MKGLLTATLVLLSFSLSAQSFPEEIYRWQKHYKEEFTKDPYSPVKAKDTGYIRFFTPAKNWQLSARVILTPDAQSIVMTTHTGRTTDYRPYAKLVFVSPVSPRGKEDTLTVYERMNLISNDTFFANNVFLPFNDLSNYIQTYGGGRYIDLRKAEVRAGKVILDFNKAYNPYCAFGGSFSCPIPPAENKLKIYIKAGEKLPTPPLLPKD